MNSVFCLASYEIKVNLYFDNPRGRLRISGFMVLCKNYDNLYKSFYVQFFFFFPLTLSPFISLWFYVIFC